uniref:Putative lipase ROG1 n=1 Tax=Davidia involucrata TaxID=16924 RepID=A0A5B6YRR3_DAVIN
MASAELQSTSETVEEVEIKRSEMDSDKNRARKKKKRSSYMPKFGCFRSDDDHPTVDKPEADGSFDMESAAAGKNSAPTHLIIMVNGIIGSAQNWRFAAKQFVKKYPQDVIVHCSKSNSSTLTFDGVDVMGKRLADEVISVIKRYPDLQKISFIGHSLGGVVARYAIAKLYGQDITRISSQENGEYRSDESKDPCLEEKFKVKIAGLEPMNFITSATPHLGSRGHKQVPVFCGFYTLEKVASRTSWFLGRTGEHLFLTDSDNGQPPLLLQMVNDCDDLKFMSALQSFRRRVAYANARFDQLVGWSTSSLRRRSELPKRQHLSRNDKYPHIVNVEAAKTADPQQELFLEAKVNGYKAIDMEEAMIRGLTKVSWERVDVNFSGSKQRFFAHNTIQVQNYRINSDGADVIQHMIDNFLL